MPLSSTARAAKSYAEFTGHEAKYLDTIKIPVPKAAWQLGVCDGILYSQVRDGVLEHYIHEFEDSARPDLASSDSNDQLLLIGGNFTVTDGGITDD